ncbi:uncharacterized protein LOC110716873 [Chenopodium quinoa]|uniref:uncharacterized protein LOC110716873 n=1 Tax=Chenopodium quinoa TaxID=63459 RepID=UPI000B76DF5C|nr:uncharacterized protein LOC110716873 [Chenopodium quinoa]
MAQIASALKGNSSTSLPSQGLDPREKANAIVSRSGKNLGEVQGKGMQCDLEGAWNLVEEVEEVPRVVTHSRAKLLGGHLSGLTTIKLEFSYPSLRNPTPWVVLSLLPIVGGVALACVTEASLNWAGFWSAMASNVTNQSRNVLSKKVMVKKEELMNNITLFSIITVMSFILLAPAIIFMEGVKFTPTYIEAAGLNVQQLYTRSLVAALCFHAYQQVTPPPQHTHKFCNCVVFAIAEHFPYKLYCILNLDMLLASYLCNAASQSHGIDDLLLHAYCVCFCNFCFFCVCGISFTW